MSRIVAISPDPERARQLASALAGVADRIECHAALDALAPGEPVQLAVIAALEAAQLAGRDAAVIAVVPAPGLAAMLDAMQGLERVVGAVVADRLDPLPLGALARQALGGAPFGLDPMMPPGTEIRSRSVGDHADKSACLSEISAFVARAAVPRRVRESIEQCADEMMMNGLYGAPVDASGTPIFSGTSAKARVGLRSQHSVVVQYACDGKRFAISARDAFGALERQTVLRVLDKCLRGTRPIESKPGGAGVGLYLMVNAATVVQFHVIPGIATEVVCVFDLAAPGLALAQLGFVVSRGAAGQRAAGPARRLSARSWRARAMALVAALSGTALAAAASPRELARPPATVELDSRPPGATVEIDGAAIGSTPLIVTSLPPGRALAIAFRRTGYRTQTVHLEVPPAGATARVVQSLAPSDDFVLVHVASEPPGAEVTRTGEPPATDRTYTPADIFVEADRIQRFTLTMPGRVPLILEPFTPARGSRRLDKGGALVPGARLRISATLDGKVGVAGAPHCADLALPADCTLAPGSYAVEFRAPDGSRFARTIEMTSEHQILELALGIVEAGPGRRLMPGGSPRAVLEAGTHTITVAGAGQRHRVVVTVRPGATVTAE